MNAPDLLIIVYIGKSSFRNCQLLAVLKIPFSVTYTFNDCISLTDIQILYSVYSIDDYAFWYSQSLKII